MPVDRLFVWCTDRPAGEGRRALLRADLVCTGLAVPRRSAEVARCPARDPAQQASDPVRPGSSPQPQPGADPHLASGRPCRRGQEASDTAAGSWEASRRPEWPSLVARHPPSRRPARGGRQQRILCSRPREARPLPPAPRASRVYRSSAGRTLTQPGVSCPESPRSCLTRLCWREERNSQHSLRDPRPDGHS